MLGVLCQARLFRSLIGTAVVAVEGFALSQRISASLSLSSFGLGLATGVILARGAVRDAASFAGVLLRLAGWGEEGPVVPIRMVHRVLGRLLVGRDMLLLAASTGRGAEARALAAAMRLMAAAQFAVITTVLIVAPAFAPLYCVGRHWRWWEVLFGAGASVIVVGWTVALVLEFAALRRLRGMRHCG